MGDRAADLARGALDIDMDPLMVASGVGELVHPVLGDLQPVGDAHLLADVVRQILKFGAVAASYVHARKSGARMSHNKARAMASGQRLAAAQSLHLGGDRPFAQARTVGEDAQAVAAQTHPPAEHRPDEPRSSCGLVARLIVTRPALTTR